MRLRELHFTARLGLTLAILVIAGGLAASASHVVNHHDKNDRDVGNFTRDDITIHYAGKFAKSPILEALEAGHPSSAELADSDALEMTPEDREFLVTWLTSDTVAADYENIDLYDFSPKELVADACASCHTGEGALTSPSGGSWDLRRDGDVLAASASERIEPIGKNILVASTHTHATTLGMLLVLVAGLALCTRFPRALVGTLILGSGLGLFLDLAAWWLARESAGLVVLVILGGSLFAVTLALQMVLAVLDMWLPSRS